MRHFAIGNRVKVSQCSGLESGEEGVIVHRNACPVNSSGVPMLGLGHYRPLGRDEEVIRRDCGKLFTMFRNRLSPARTELADLEALGKEFAEAKARAEANRKRFVAEACTMYATDDINIDDDAKVSYADDGACWVQAWVYVPGSDNS